MNTPLDCFETGDPEGSVPVLPVDADGLARWTAAADAPRRAWVEAAGFRAEPASLCTVPSASGLPDCVLLGIPNDADGFELGVLPGSLPAGRYRLESSWPSRRREQALLAFALGAYRYRRYRSAPEESVRMCLSGQDDAARLAHLASAIYLTRDLINTPANDLLPDALEAAARSLAEQFGATLDATVGEDLLEQGYPAVHAVGRASACAPRLLDLRHGDPDWPLVTLVGKGVCFDSGGLDIKPASGMRLMKKDMGGAAHVLGLARAIMGLGLRIRLRVLVCAVENAISGNAMRPGDVLPTRKGSHIEIDNTDAEGRVILSDALTEACRERPRLLADFATLTGAARVAVGTEIAAMFCNDDDLAAELSASGERVADPVWRMPLHASYRKLIESKVADISNSGSTPFGGAITAALFLEHFVDAGIPWVHFDIMAWNVTTRPGRPEGGEAMGMRALLACLEQRFG